MTAIKRIAPFAALIGLAIIPYLHTLNYPFVWDDAVFIERNDRIHHMDTPSRFFTDPDTLSSKPEYNRQIYRPLRTLIFSGLYGQFGMFPLPYRLVNILLHGGCTLLLFFVGRQISGSLQMGWFGAAIFAVHPIHSEAVTWISSLADGLSTFFYLLGFVVYLKRTTLAKLIAVLIIFPVGLLAKEMAITFPVILAIYELWQRPLSGSSPLNQRLGTLSIVGCGFLMAGVYFLWRSNVLGAVGQFPFTMEYALTAVAKIPLVIAAYVEMLFIPVNQCSLRPAIDPSQATLFGYAVSTGILIISGILITWGYLKRSPTALWGLCFFGTLLPILNLLPVVIDVAERFVYLPSAWFSLSLGYILVNALKRLTKRTFAYGAAAAYILCLGLGTMITNQKWQNELVLFTSQTQCPNTDPNAYWNLGNALMDQEEWAQAVSVYNHMRQKAWDTPKILNNLAYAHIQLEQWNTAEQISRQSVQMVPTDPVALNNLGTVLLGQGRISQAISVFTKLTQIAPDYTNGFINLGLAHLNENNWTEARQAFETALRLSPNHNEIQTYLKIAIQNQSPPIGSTD